MDRPAPHHDRSPTASRRADSEAERPRRWEVACSVYGRGTTLFGPLEGGVSLVLAPPAVPLPTPPNWTAPLASSGWRAAWLMPLADGSVILDEQEPFELEALSLSDAVGIVLEHCPENLGWIADQVRMRADTTAFACKPDRAGRLPGDVAHREATLLALLADAEKMLDDHAGRLVDIEHCPLDERWVSDLRDVVAPVIDRALLAGAQLQAARRGG